MVVPYGLHVSLLMVKVIFQRMVGMDLHGAEEVLADELQ